jgi:hypothetical protein
MALFSLRRRSVPKAVLALLFAVAGYSAPAQVIPGLIARPDISIYGTLPVNVTPDFSYATGPVLFGYSLGGFLQTRHVLGAEVRGSIQRRQNPQHQEAALAGPRFALHFGNVSPYVSVLFGASNAWRFRNPPIAGEKLPKPTEDLGYAWMVAGGVDVHLTHHLGIRVGEISYTKIDLKEWNLTPLNFTAGIVYRIN